MGMQYSSAKASPHIMVLHIMAGIQMFSLSQIDRRKEGNIMGKYVDSKVWLRISGCAVEGWDVDDLNHYIDQWNSQGMSYTRLVGDFWGWLSYERGYDILGFSSIWRSKLDSLIHTIKR